jgi:hypothetical protein
MGLDITAYGFLTIPTEPVDLDEYGEPKDWRGFWKPGADIIEWTESNWPGRTEGVDRDALYCVSERFAFRAGSYSGYNSWRNWLATVAGYRDAEDCWQRASPGEPFYELIHFADNEGVIGPVVAKKLAADFAKHAGKAVELAPAESWCLDAYARWWCAFLTAQHRGAVEFH